jgi:sulfite reductase (NADPH) flavoprotein alpha-component
MASGVETALIDIVGKEGVDQLIESGRYRRDVY